METTALMKLDMSTMLDRVDQTRFPKDLTLADRRLIAKVSIEYGLDPLFGELMIYQGRPYVTIDARRRKAQETDKLDGISARPATKAERQARQVADGDYLFVAEVWVKGSSHAFEGWGRITQKEIDAMIASAKSHGMKEDALPIVKDPAAMAEKRAEAQALRRAFHLPLPSFEEVIEGEFTEITSGKEAPQSKSSPSKAQASPPAPTQNNRLTQPQKNKIWGDAEKMGYTAEAIRLLIGKKWGLSSVNDLTVPQASDLIGMIARGEGIPAPEAEDLGLEAPLHENPDDSN